MCGMRGRVPRRFGKGVWMSSKGKNNGPVAQDDAAQTDYRVPVTVNLLANDSDPDGDRLRVIAVAESAAGSSVVNPDGTVTFTPAEGFSGEAEIRYAIDDGRGGVTTAVLRVSVAAPEGDGIVQGTAGDDLINADYTGDPQGDRIDHGDARLPGEVGDDDIVHAGAGNDTVIGGAGDDEIFGEDGDDLLVGGAGNNALFGGAGDDTFVGGEGADTFHGGPGLDVIDYSGSAAGVSVDLSTGALSGGDAANDVIGGGIDGVIGSQHADSLVGFDQQNTDPGDRYTNVLRGNDGDDTIRGAGGDDSLYGDAGNDSIDGGTGDDLIYGGEGSDSITGGAGNDTIYGDGASAPSGPVTITIEPGSAGYVNAVFAYTIDPETGEIRNIQTLTGNANLSQGESFQYYAPPGALIGVGIVSPEGRFLSSGYGANAGLNSDGLPHTGLLSGGTGGSYTIGFEDMAGGGDGDFNDVVVKVDVGRSGVLFDNAHVSPGSQPGPALLEGDDLIDAGDGDDEVHGGGGNDTILGGAGNDRLFGDAGADVIDGGAGADDIYGGAGSDRIVVGSAEEGIGDRVDGGEDPDGSDVDVLDLSGAGPLRVNYNSDDPESGTVDFLNADGSVKGSLEFTGIERVVPCFTPGTRVATPKGPRLVEELRAGDAVLTRDNGVQRISWAGRRDLSQAELLLAPHLRPVRIGAGSLGAGVPERDMIVSPNHRMLLADPRAALYFGEHEVLAAAKHLVDGQHIQALTARPVSYLHFMFDRHQIVLADGAWTESFQPGEQSLDGMGKAQRDEILSLFPDLRRPEGLLGYGSARTSLRRHEARLLASDRARG